MFRAIWIAFACKSAFAVEARSMVHTRSTYDCFGNRLKGLDFCQGSWCTPADPVAESEELTALAAELGPAEDLEG